MWWPYIPWLLFVLALGGTFAAYRLTHRHEQACRSAAAAIEGPSKPVKEQ